MNHTVYCYRKKIECLTVVDPFKGSCAFDVTKVCQHEVEERQRTVVVEHGRTRSFFFKNWKQAKAFVRRIEGFGCIRDNKPWRNPSKGKIPNTVKAR